MPVKGDASSTTKAAIAPGTIDIRENPTQDISALSRDTVNALNELGRIFDKQTMEERQELAAVFGEEAFRLLHNMKDDGSVGKIAAHAAVAGILSQITGNGFTSGAAGAGLNEALIKALDGKDPGTAQLISAIIGAAAAKAIDGNAQAGASAAASGTKWNKYERLPEIKVQLDAVLKSEDYQNLEDGAFIFLRAIHDNQEVYLAMDNSGNAWDLTGYYKKSNSREFENMAPTIFNAELNEFVTDILRSDGQYLGKILPSAKEISTSKNNVQDNNTRFKQFASAAHEGLDWAGYIPGLGSAAGIADSALYLVEGNYKEAIISAATIIPGAKYVKAAKKLTGVPGISRLIRTEKNTPSRLPNAPGKTENTLDQGQKSRAENFRNEIMHLPDGERQARILTEMKSLAEEKGWKRSNVFSDKSRTVYFDKKENCYYSVDTRHGTLEKLDRRGQHLGEYNIDLHQIDPPDKSGGHNLKR